MTSGPLPGRQGSRRQQLVHMPTVIGLAEKWDGVGYLLMLTSKLFPAGNISQPARLYSNGGREYLEPEKLMTPSRSGLGNATRRDNWRQTFPSSRALLPILFHSDRPSHRAMVRQRCWKPSSERDNGIVWCNSTDTAVGVSAQVAAIGTGKANTTAATPGTGSLPMMPIATPRSRPISMCGRCGPSSYTFPSFPIPIFP